MPPNPKLSTASVVLNGKVPVRTVADLGRLLRQQRQQQKLSIHHAASLSGLSLRFVQDLEAGKRTIQMGRALDYAAKLGVILQAAPTHPGEQET
jgi:transcriptional regulator with XRE-family HTH domain